MSQRAHTCNYSQSLRLHNKAKHRCGHPLSAEDSCAQYVALNPLNAVSQGVIENVSHHFGPTLKMTLCECEMRPQCMEEVHHICACLILSLRNEPKGRDITLFPLFGGVLSVAIKICGAFD